MGTDIQRAAVLGAGVMGSGIAAHLANAGIPVVLLDIVPPELTEEDEKKGLTKDDPRFRNKFSAVGLEGIKKSLSMTDVGLGMMKTGRLNPMEIIGGHSIKDTSGLKKMLAKAQEIEEQHIADYKG